MPYCFTCWRSACTKAPSFWLGSAMRLRGTLTLKFLLNALRSWTVSNESKPRSNRVLPWILFQLPPDFMCFSMKSSIPVFEEAAFGDDLADGEFTFSAASLAPECTNSRTEWLLHGDFSHSTCLHKVEPPLAALARLFAALLRGTRARWLLREGFRPPPRPSRRLLYPSVPCQLLPMDPNSQQ